MRAWGITDVGLRRRENQDTYAFETFGKPDTVIAVVCDGMGGVHGGQLASSLAVATFMDELHNCIHVDMTVDQVKEAASYSIAQANRAVFERSMEDPSYWGMGTTLVSAVASSDIAVLCNIGDSRAYHIGEQGITRITRDHSVVEDLIASGDITREQARTHPNRNLITRALGPDKTILCDSFVTSLSVGDCLLLCSDGLNVTMEDFEILEIVRAAADGEQALARLLELSKSRGAPDNVTAVLIQNDGEEATRQDG